MDKLIKAWDKQLASQGLSQHAIRLLRDYEANVVPDSRYGVFVLCRPDHKGGGAPPFEALVHVNHAFPRTSKPVLRLNWGKLAPRYQWSADPVADHARIWSMMIASALRLSQSALKSVEVKLYLPTSADRAYGKALATALVAVPTMPVDVHMKGAWLHFVWR